MLLPAKSNFNSFKLPNMPGYGSFLYNSALYNGGNQNAPAYLTDLVVFDGFSLSDNTNVVTQKIIDSEPTRDLIGDKIPRADGQYLIADYYRIKEITVEGLVKQSTAALLDAYLETIRQNLRRQSAYLDITRNGVVRRYVATLNAGQDLFSQRQFYNVTICPFTAKFECRTPFAKDRDYSAVSQAVTVAPTTIAVNNSGTIKSQPIIALIFDAASSVTQVNITNSTTSEQIQYAGTCNTGDVLIFDSEAKAVTLNGATVDFSGSFPTLEVGANLVKVTVTGASFNAYTTVRAKNTYL